MPAIKQPVTQKRLTNIAIVRLRSHGKRFEIACYKNKVMNWREGIEKDLGEVIQTDQIFVNVSKGEFAKEADLRKVFGTIDNEEICRKILKTGELQVSDKERDVHLEVVFRDIVQLVVERCIQPQTGRQLTAPMVEGALKSLGFSVQPDQAPKRQALKAIELLCAELPDNIARAKMRLRIVCAEELGDAILAHLKENVMGVRIDDEGHDAARETRSITFVCDPSHYRELDRLVTVTHAGSNITLQIVASAVIAEGACDATAAGASSSALPVALPLPSPLPLQVMTEGVGGGDADAAAVEGLAAAAAAAQGAKAAAPTKKGSKCSTCNTILDNPADYREHCRSEWHNRNLSRKVNDQPPLTWEEFENDF